MTDKKIIVRFAPSPTGFLHIGSTRTALFNYLFAKHTKGKILLRIEDTDKERSTKEFEDNIFESFKWLGFVFDDTFIQSKLVDTHKKYLRHMIESGTAYLSKEEPKEAGERAEVIRFKNPNTTITFTDLIRGEISFDTTELGDFVIAKSLDEPLYHLAVVIDDFLMGVTHVIRGEEHISNTPRQILIQQAIGAPQPQYAHLPIILAKDRSKLSKRKHGASVSIPFYMEEGYLPEALINYLALLGWNPGTDQEIFSLDELIAQFDISKVQKSGAIFDDVKLRFFNKEYLKMMPRDIFEEKLQSIFEGTYPNCTEMIPKISTLVLERISTFGDVRKDIALGEYGYFFAQPEYAKEGLEWKGKKKNDTGVTPHTHLEKVLTLLSPLSDANFTKEKIKETIWPYAEESGRGEVLWPFRFALSGREKSPDPFILAEILGKKETLKRISVALVKG